MAYRDAFEKGMQIARNAEGAGDGEMTDKKARRTWPFE